MEAARSLVIPPIQGALGSNPVAILFHGLTGTPIELEELAVVLAREGYRVVVPCLPGHGTSVQDLSKITFDEFLSAARSLFHYFKNRGTVVGGMSFGALLALWCALEVEKKPMAVMLVSPPFKLRSRTKERMLGMLSKFSEGALSKLGYSKKNKRNLGFERHAYSVHSVGAAARLFKLRQMVVERLGSLKMPILMLQDPFDHHLDPDGTEKAVEFFGSAEVDTIWLPRGEHELTLGEKKQELFVAVREFLRRARSHAT